MESADYEKLGVFYLGRPYDLATKQAAAAPLLYDSRDLVTHALCVGMTGSGKTGLCISLLEEAAIDGIPAIAIDPKGDLANLLLTFPELRPADFLDWVNTDDAARKGLSIEQFAEQQAQLWRKGLADWDQTPQRIAKLRSSAEFAVYTPGSRAGVPISVLKGFAPPPPSILEDAELLAEQVSTAVSGLLGLLGIEADPMQSREHILIAAILRSNWQEGRGVDLARLITQVQRPPLERVGVMDVESFFPEKDRFALAMRINNLLAAPGFEAWLEGEPLDVGALFRTPAGKPRISIVSIAHLSDAERMFFVTLLLGSVLGWTRSQSGTTSLRAILYMDEIFGYFPPVANPPSKQPLLTLLKQARAFGVGVVLATQNPVDLDYKGLSNCGTWFIGRLQTERDKQRVMEGLEGAAAGGSFDRSATERLIAGLGNRVFLMNNVHEDGPVVFHTRWAMSYLRGPLTRDQIRKLSQATAAAPAASPPQAPETRPRADSRAASTSAAPPVLPPGLEQVFLPVRAHSPEASAQLQYIPAVIGMASVAYSDSRLAAAHQRDLALLAPAADGLGVVDWTVAVRLEIAPTDLARAAQPNAAFAPVPADLLKPKALDDVARKFAAALPDLAGLKLLRSDSLRLVSEPGEDERSFRVRLAQVAREERDQTAQKLRQKYAPKLRTLEDRLRRAEQQVQNQQRQATSAGWNTAVSVGSAVLGAIFGRKKMSVGNVGRAASAARGAGRTHKEARDVAGARENAEAIRQQLTELEAEFQAELAAVQGRIDAATERLETVEIRPKRGDVSVKLVALAWAPQWQSGTGTLLAYA